MSISPIIPPRAVPRIVLIRNINDAELERLSTKRKTLTSDERAFVDAAPSHVRQALRVLQLDIRRTHARPGDHISVAHTDDTLAVALSAARVGIDIEPLCELPHGTDASDDGSLSLGQLFSVAEQETIRDGDSFTRAWVRKEAYAKWLGTGLTDELANGVYETETHVFLHDDLYVSVAGLGSTEARIKDSYCRIVPKNE
ncbi:MAG: 4'-phosphopantetheinyl transferase superfamily protein [Coriobacteriia bacterium]|nr:4'-phosphopantetheinyl transferase superfamily protein [Coriobacteriia bacterium]